jgi:hypothetical protein
MKKLLLFVLVLCVSLSLSAQQAPPPDIITPSAAYSVALTAYKSWAEGQITGLWTGVIQQQALTSNLPQDEANIAALQASNTQMAAQIATLQAQIAGLTPPPTTPPPTGTVTVVSFAVGAQTLNGLQPSFGNIGFTQGNWDIINHCLVPASATVISPTLTIPSNMALVGVTAAIASGSSAASFTATDASGHTISGTLGTGPILFSPTAPATGLGGLITFTFTGSACISSLTLEGP